MDISAGLIAKGTAGALAASATVGGGVWAGTNGWFDGLFPNGDVSTNIREEETEKVPSSEDSRAETPSTGGPDVPSAPPTQQTAPQGVTGSAVGSVDTAITVEDSIGVGDEPNNDQPGTPQSQTQDTNENGDFTVVSAKTKSQKSAQSVEPTKWDKAFIDYLKESGKDDRDIEFTVKKGKDASEDLSNTFPSFEEETARDKGTTDKQKSVITITVAAMNTDLKGADSDTEKEKLKKMNGGEINGKDWTWECKIFLSKDKADGDSIDILENKEELFGENGYFNRLKKMVSGEDNNESKKNLRDLKVKFIENCTKSRKDTKAKEFKDKSSLTDSSEKVNVKKTFELEAGTDATKWKIKNKELKEWFSSASSLVK